MCCHQNLNPRSKSRLCSNIGEKVEVWREQRDDTGEMMMSSGRPRTHHSAAFPHIHALV